MTSLSVCTVKPCSLISAMAINGQGLLIILTVTCPEYLGRAGSTNPPKNSSRNSDILSGSLFLGGRGLSCTKEQPELSSTSAININGRDNGDLIIWPPNDSPGRRCPVSHIRMRYDHKWPLVTLSVSICMNNSYLQTQKQSVGLSACLLLYSTPKQGKRYSMARRQYRAVMT